MNYEIKNKDTITKYLEMIQEKNKVMNLTAVDNFDEMWSKHVVDSLTVLPLIEKYNVKNLIDVETGAGIPGIILKIEEESLYITLMDSLKKRIKFLDDVVENLNLNNVKTIHSRAEELARNKERESYDGAISRAVARLNTLVEYALPLVKIGGYFFAMKGPAIDEEIEEAKNAIEILGGEIIEKVNFNYDFGERNILIIRKIKNTPKKYPRTQNKPKTNPL